MAGPAAALSVPADVVYGTGRIDASGRVTDQTVTCALGWREGDRLTLTAEPGVVIARRDPRGMVTVPARACVAIPAVLRRRCGLRAGDRVLLAAVPGQDMLAAYSFAVVDQALRAHGTFPHAKEDSRDNPAPGRAPGRIPAGRRRRGAAAAGADGPVPGDLVAVPQDRPPVPTFAEYVPVVSAAVSAGTRRAYGSYWNRVIDQWGERRLDEPTPSEIRQLMSYVKTHVVARRNARGGRSAAEHLVAALRCLYKHAEDDGLSPRRTTRPGRWTSRAACRPPGGP